MSRVYLRLELLVLHSNYCCTFVLKNKKCLGHVVVITVLTSSQDECLLTMWPLALCRVTSLEQLSVAEFSGE